MKTPNTKDSRNGTKHKQQYKVTNWKEYNKALKQRGSVTLWIPDDITEWWYATEGRETYTDAAIEVMTTLKAVYRQAWRQSEGLARSVFEVAGLPLDVPDYATCSRRTGTSTPTVRVSSAKDAVYLIPDSTGAKITGDGEWKTRKHGPSKHRRWKKIHLSVDADGEIIAEETTDNDVHDADVIHSLLAGEGEEIAAVAGDGAYDRAVVYTALSEHGVTDVRIPPRKDAKVWYHGNITGPPHPRDENLRAIRRSTRSRWKKTSGYHIRSRGETAMYRFKTTFGERLASRKHENQCTEVSTKCRVLNVFHSLGMPESVAVAGSP